MKVFESDLLENEQVVATKAGHFNIRVDSCQVKKLKVKRSIVCSLGHLGLARSLRFEKKTSMMLSVRFVEMIIYLLLEDNLIITIPIGKENVDTVIQTDVWMYHIDFITCHLIPYCT